MRELNYKNQHEIGFDIDSLSPHVNYIAKDKVSPYAEGYKWHGFHEKPFMQMENWVERNRFLSMSITKDYAPKNFTGDWKESLFKINRENLVNYNGTVI